MGQNPQENGRTTGQKLPVFTFEMLIEPRQQKIRGHGLIILGSTSCSQEVHFKLESLALFCSAHHSANVTDPTNVEYVTSSY